MTRNPEREGATALTLTERDKICLMRGADDERAAIVAWLRKQSEISDEQFYSAYAHAAAAIESQQHLTREG